MEKEKDIKNKKTNSSFKDTNTKVKNKPLKTTSKKQAPTISNVNSEEHKTIKQNTTAKKLESSEHHTKGVSSRDFLTTLILCIFLGSMGVHRFYAGKVGTGLIWLFTFGLFGIGYIVDIIMITAQSFDDIEGKPITVL